MSLWTPRISVGVFVKGRSPSASSGRCGGGFGGGGCDLECDISQW